MNSYTANPNAAKAPSPAPGPGVIPVINSPQDLIDDVNAANFAQQSEVNADFIAHIQSAVHLDTPAVAASGSGFTSPSYASFGGTVAPSGSVKINTGTRFVIKIIAGGSVGTATFQTSTDGGNTFGSTQTTAASMTDATSGITLAFTGTLTINGTASFRSAFTPQASRQDAAGNIRSLVDHNGYPMGRITRLQEDWLGAFATISAATNPLSNFAKWAFTNNSTESMAVQPPNATYPANYVDLATLASGSSQTMLYFNRACVAPSSSLLSFVFECEVGLANVGAAISQADIAFGFNTNNGSTPPYSSSIMLRYSGSGNWIASTSGGGSQDTGVAPSAATDPSSGQRFRFEIHGSSSPYGAVCLFFINEALCASLTTGIPSAILFPIFNLKNSTAAINHMYIGSVSMAWNRWLSVPAL